MLKILQARLQQHMKCELPDVQAGFRNYAKAFDCVYHNTLWKILKEMGIPNTWPASWEICMQVRKQQLELNMEQQTGSK